MLRNLKTLTLALLLISGSAAAQTDDINAAARAVAANNLSVKSLKASLNQELESARAENVLQGPEAGFDYKVAGGNAENRWGVSLSQGFNWPGAYTARSRAIDAQAKANEANVRNEFLTQALAAKEAMIEAIAVKEQLKLVGEASARMGRLKNLMDSARYAGMLEIRRLGLEQFSLESRKAQLEERLAQLTATLTMLNGGQAVDIPAVKLSAQQLRPMDYFTQQRHLDPKAWAAKYTSEMNGSAVKAAKASALPSFSLGITHDYEERVHFNGISVGISLPSWKPSRAVAAATGALAASEYELASRTATVDAEIKADYEAAQALYSRIQPYEATFAQDDYGMLLSQAVERRDITIFQFLTEYSSYLAACADYNELLMKYATVNARLNRYDLLPQE